jgi:hypothetical protein
MSEDFQTENEGLPAAVLERIDAVCLRFEAA